jgi:hypothetical protein
MKKVGSNVSVSSMRRALVGPSRIVEAVCAPFRREAPRRRRTASRLGHYAPAETSCGTDGKHMRDAKERQFAAWG